MNSQHFGHTPAGANIERYTLLDPATQASVDIITLGAIITSLKMPDHRGQLADVVLGFDSLADYLQPHPYFGAIAGRVAGRISNARFSMAAETYHLAPNDPPNHLHGGPVGFDRHIWTAHPIPRPDGAPSLRLTTQSPDGDQGYPGSIEVAITYTLTSDLVLLVETQATTDQATPLNLTQHSYFNLSGAGNGSCLDHILEIPARSYAPADDRMTLLGRREPVTPANDFARPRRLGDAVDSLHQKHGDLYFLREPIPMAAPRASQWVARLHDLVSGRQLNVHSDEDCLQFYTGVSLNDSIIGKSGHSYGPYTGVCLECEGYADGPNTPAIGDIILQPGHTLRRSTHYAFSAIPPA
jgi:aldose 1-epimerase